MTYPMKLSVMRMKYYFEKEAGFGRSYVRDNVVIAVFWRFGHVEEEHVLRKSIHGRIPESWCWLNLHSAVRNDS